jgi:phage tail protein X
MDSHIVTNDKDRLDLICYRHYGRLEGGIVETVLIANPGLSAKPYILPAGVKIILPEISNSFIENKTVKLWS